MDRMRRRRAYDGFVPATTKGGKIPASATGADVRNVGGDGAAGRAEEAASKTAGAGPPQGSGSKETELGTAPLSASRFTTATYVSGASWLRQSCCISGVDFELVRYRQFFGEEMRSKAREAGSGIAPWMIVNGRCLTQTSAICRFASDIAGITPADPFLAAKVDEVVQSITDFYEVWTRITAEGFALSKGSRKKQQKIPKLIERLREEEGPFFFSFIDKLLRENGAEDHAFLVGDSLTVADVALWRMVGSMSDDACTTSPVKYWPREMTDRRYRVSRATSSGLMPTR